MSSKSDNLTVPEVAADLRCSKAHVCKLVNGTVANTPRLPAIRLGRRILIRRTMLELWKLAIEQGTDIDVMMLQSGRSAVDAWKKENHA